MTNICVGKLTIIGSDNGLSPGRRQAIIWTNAGILLIWSLGTNFNEILIEIKTFSFKKMRLKVSSAKWRPFCLGLNELNKNWKELHLTVAYLRLRMHFPLPRLRVPTWGPSGADRTQVGLMLAPWTFLSGILQNVTWYNLHVAEPQSVFTYGSYFRVPLERKTVRKENSNWMNTPPRMRP